MFEKSENLQVVVERITFRSKNSREKDPTKIVEITFEAPLDRELAIDVVPEMADDLFTSRGKPKVDMADVGYNVKPGQYLMAARLSPAGRQQKLSGCTIRNVNAYKASGDANGAWLLGFTVAFILLTPEEVLPFIKHLRQAVFLTFEEQEPTMDLQDGDDAGGGAEAKVNRRGEVESISERRGGKKTGGDVH